MAAGGETIGIRVGQGWDVHRLVTGRPLRLGGVSVPSERGLLGHSDGDVVVHALCDALLGAVGSGDIGTHFPDTDPTYRGIDSTILLQRVVASLGESGYRVENADVTILAEQPRLAPILPAIRQRLAELLQVDGNRIGVKAKTMEGLGTIGEGNAIAAIAVALLVRT